MELGWGKYVICQKNTNEHLRYPMLVNGQTDQIHVYSAFLKNI